VLASRALAEIIEFEDFLRARARRREQALSARCLVIMEDCLVASRVAYGCAHAGERPIRAAKIRQLEDLIAYTAQLV
jgi:hypothetical protein